jgi:hypothetical protein
MEEAGDEAEAEALVEVVHDLIRIMGRGQGDRIGRIFAKRVIAHFGQFFENDGSSQDFLATFSYN